MFNKEQDVEECDATQALHNNNVAWLIKNTQ